MADTIKIKHSATANAAPPNLAPGEIAINTADDKIFYKKGTEVVARSLIGGEPSGTRNLCHEELSAGAGIEITKTYTITDRLKTIGEGYLFQVYGATGATAGNRNFVYKFASAKSAIPLIQITKDTNLLSTQFHFLVRVTLFAGLLVTNWEWRLGNTTDRGRTAATLDFDTGQFNNSMSFAVTGTGIPKPTDSSLYEAFLSKIAAPVQGFVTVS